MNNRQRFWYLDELVTQSLSAVASHATLRRYLANPETKQTLFVWTNVSAFLGHVGIISKVLYPARQSSRDRATEIKETLDLPELPNLAERAGRDNIEHIDERIDNWAAKDIGSLISMVFDDRAGYEYICTPDKAVRRALIESELIYISENQHGERVETSLQPLLAEIEIVRDKASTGIQADPPYHVILAAALHGHAR
ncbi:hypothetical protein [Luteimonas sp. R10]|uniref:hypothetical protein n=1 Tax=Luteimonas sp. R10 TaxID=3108176 RepID=UPI00309351B1|nr:hypothetical protein U3649_03390 [Luteimonas sp. R10]